MAQKTDYAGAPSTFFKTPKHVLTFKDAMTIIKRGYDTPHIMVFLIMLEPTESKMTSTFETKPWNFGDKDKALFWDTLRALKKKPNQVYTKLNRPDRDGTMRFVLAIRSEGDDFPEPIAVLAISSSEAGLIFWFKNEKNRDDVHTWLTKTKAKSTVKEM
jgi:hypothetical protein